ncbi:MAG TPA: hypothetical protein VF177_08060 [Anaerolineae bacterium]
MVGIRWRGQESGRKAAGLSFHIDEASPPAMTEQTPRLPTGTVEALLTPSPEVMATTTLADASATAAITSEAPPLATDTVEASPTPPAEVTATTTLANESPTAAITGEPSPVTGDGDSTVEWTNTLRLTALATADFPDARSIDMAVTDSGTVYVSLGMDERIFVSRSNDSGRTFSQPVSTSQDQPALVLALERPAISATDDGQVYVAWSSPDRLSSIWFAHSTDGGKSFGPSIRLSGSAQMETILPRMALDPAGQPAVAWLQSSTLRLARSDDGGQSFSASDVIDDKTCDCCHPQPLIAGKHVFIAYRNLEEEGGQQIRNIFFTASADDGATFAPEVRVSDSHWYLSACPISGPTLAFDGTAIYASWMDGRHDSQGNFSHTDIWLATSTDMGQTFSANRRVNPKVGVYNNLPSLAIDGAGQLHIIWEAREAAQEVIYYARSADGGHSFGTPSILVSSQDGSGRKRPGNASLVLGPEGTVYITWVDTLGAHAGAWSVE